MFLLPGYFLGGRGFPSWATLPVRFLQLATRALGPGSFDMERDMNRYEQVFNKYHVKLSYQRCSQSCRREKAAMKPPLAALGTLVIEGKARRETLGYITQALWHIRGNFWEEQVSFWHPIYPTRHLHCNQSYKNLPSFVKDHKQHMNDRTWKKHNIIDINRRFVFVFVPLATSNSQHLWWAHESWRNAMTQRHDLLLGSFIGDV